MKIKLENIKSIKKLEFEIPKKKGVHIITGANGCGKTSLLIAIYRLSNNNAFAQNYKSPKKDNLIDDFKNAQITYEIDNVSVTFKKSKERWGHSPRKNKNIVWGNFPYNGVKYIKADGARIEPTQKELEEIKSRRKCDIKFVEVLNEIFETKKYDNLRRIKSGAGRTADIYLIKSGRGYYSEKQFSLGELLIIRIVNKVLEAESNSIILIDEIEIALHPRVQKKLIKFLENISIEKDLLIIISTHSSTLVKSIKKENTILLERDNKGIVECINPCYASRALRNIDFESSTQPDYLFLVEDDAAKSILDFMIKKLYSEDLSLLRMTHETVPIGGMDQVISFLKNSENILFNGIRVLAILDNDALEKENIKKVIEENKNIGTLPCTPELGTVTFLEGKKYDINGIFKERLECKISLSEILESAPYQELKAKNPRSLGKKKLEYIIKEVQKFSDKNSKLLEREIYGLYIQDMPMNEINKSIKAFFKWTR